MEKNKKNLISRIIHAYLSKRFSEEKEEKVQRWLIKDSYAEEKEQASLSYWNDLKKQADSNTAKALERVNKRIGFGLKLPLYKKISRIAAILIPLLLIGGGLLYYTSTQNNFIEISTAYGESTHLLLPDESEVWLNAGTTIKYPRKFQREQRTVILNGEAFFSVSKDSLRPFIVEAGGLDVKVLGTEFNVKSYSNDIEAVATLKSGKVAIYTHAKEAAILHPNEQFTLNNQTLKTTLSTVSSEETSAWKEGKLIFTDASWMDILQTLERKFNVQIINKSNISSSKRYTIKFLKRENLQEILSLMKNITDIQYKIDKDQIIIEDNEKMN